MKVKLNWLLSGCFFLLMLFLINYSNKELNLTSTNKGSLAVGYSDSLTKEEREWLNEQGTIVYSADKNAPPLRFVDRADNQYKGVVVDYVNLLSLEMGLNIELHPLLWEDALDNLSKGKTDMCDMFKSEERSNHYLFTKSIYNLRAVLALRSDESNIVNIVDLKGKTIATQKGDYVNGYIKKYYPDIKMRYVADVYEALKLLSENKVDAVAGDEPVVLYQIDKSNLKNFVRVMDKPLYENEVVFAVPKSKPELVNILNKGIDIMNRKDHLEKIQQKWFGISAPIVKAQDVSRLKYYILASMLIAIPVLFIMAVINKSLKSQVESRTKELEDSRNDLQTVFDGITEFMIVVDEKKNIVNVNRAFLNYIGEEKDKLISKSCSSYIQGFCENCENCIITRTFDSTSNCEDEVYSRSEAYGIHTYPLKDSKGRVKNVLMAIQNITNEKISKNQLLQANKMIAVGQLAAGVAHEIRNPLGIIRNHSFILRTTEGLDDRINRSLDYIDSSVERASKIIDNLLNFSRISGNTQEWIDIKNFIKNIMELQNKQMKKHWIKFEIDCKDNLKCFINQESLKHILINLISNSIDAISEDGTIYIKVEENEDGTVIECADTGCGIEKENLEKIFNPFYTSKGPGKGTGLGLYIVYNEVKKLNGQITVESVVNAGTKFKVFLPVNTEVSIA